MRTRRWSGFIGLAGIMALLLATLASAGQPRPATAAVQCVFSAFDIKGGDSGAPVSFHEVPGADEECVKFQIPEGQIALLGGDMNRAVSGSTELHNVNSSLKALAWPADQVIEAHITWGQIRLVDARRGQCEFERWLAAEKGFQNGGFPLPEWTGQTAVCGPLDGGGSGATFNVDAKPGLVQPGQPVQFVVTSDPAGQTARLKFDSSNMVDVVTPKAIAHVYSANSHWQLLSLQGAELASGDVEVLPTRGCFALPARDTWNEGAVPFSFSTDEDKSGGNTLHICGDMPSGYTLLVSGEFVAGESYGVLGVYSGKIDMYVRNAFIEGVAGCSARPEFDRLKAAGGSNLSIFHAPSACSVRQYVPIAKR